MIPFCGKQQVPAFEDDKGFCLFESNAIAYYLATEELRGGDCQQNRALVQQWMSFADTEVLPAACSWVFPAVGVLNQAKQVRIRSNCICV